VHGSVPGARQHIAQQIARRLARRQRLLGQARRELALYAKHELHAREAVQAEVALERAIERDAGVDVRTGFSGDGGDDGEQPVGIYLG